MGAIYGHRWSSSYGDDPTGLVADTWAAGLAGLTGEQLAHGLEASIASSAPWPPTLPEFRLMCLRVPSLSAVRREFAAYLAWSPASEQSGQKRPRLSPFTRLVLEFLPVYQYRHEDARRAEAMLQDAYEEAKEHVVRGGLLPVEPVAEIGEPERREPTAEEAEASRLNAEQAIREISRLLHPAEPDPVRVSPHKDREPLASAEPELRAHYGVDRKTQAAGPDV